jgi:hypothetical protein
MKADRAVMARVGLARLTASMRLDPSRVSKVNAGIREIGVSDKKIRSCSGPVIFALEGV